MEICEETNQKNSGEVEANAAVRRDRALAEKANEIKHARRPLTQGPYVRPKRSIDERTSGSVTVSKETQRGKQSKANKREQMQVIVSPSHGVMAQEGRIDVGSTVGVATVAIVVDHPRRRLGRAHVQRQL